MRELQETHRECSFRGSPRRRAGAHRLLLKRPKGRSSVGTDAHGQHTSCAHPRPHVLHPLEMSFTHMREG